MGFISQTHYIPEDDLTIAVLSNSNFGGGAIDVADQVMRKMLRIPGPVDLPVPAGVAQRYVGRYCMDNDVVEIVLKNDHLFIDLGGGETRRLRYQGEAEFTQDGRLSRLGFRERDTHVEGFVIARYGARLAKATREN